MSKTKRIIHHRTKYRLHKTQGLEDPFDTFSLSGAIKPIEYEFKAKIANKLYQLLSTNNDISLIIPTVSFYDVRKKIDGGSPCDAELHCYNLLSQHCKDYNNVDEYIEDFNEGSDIDDIDNLS